MEKDRKVIEDIIKKFFEKNAEKYFVEIVFIYGSVVKGFVRDESDIDIAVVFSDKVSKDDEIFEIITEISATLTTEISREVNVIPIYPDFRHPMLYYNAIIHGIPLFIRDFNRFITLKNKAIYEMEDFSIFGIGWQLEIARNNLKEIDYD